MKSIVSFLEDVFIHLANDKERRAQKKFSQRISDDMPPAIGWIMEEGLSQNNRPLTITQDQRSKHLYVLGATGSGKTNLILHLIDQDLRENRSIVVIDLRGDLVDRVLRRIAASKSEADAKYVLLLDLRDKNRIIGFNPLGGTGDPSSRAYHVLDSIKANSDSWGIQLEETLRNALIALAEANLSLLEIEPLLTAQSFRGSVLQKCTDPSVLAFFERYNSLSLERQQAWFLPVFNKVTPLLGTPRLRQLFGASSTIDFARALNTEGSIVLIALAVDRLHSAAKLVGNLIVGAIESAVMSRVDQSERDRVPVNLYVDEFESMATEAFASIVAEGRRFRLSLTLSHQNLYQLSVNLRHVVRNNVQTQVFFQTGSVDARELRHELSFGEEEDIVSRLQSLPVGHAYFHQRPNEPVMVRFEKSTDPKVASNTLASFIDSVHQAMGSLSRAEVQESIVERRRKIGGGQGESAGSRPSMMVRHERLPRRKKEPN